ncbi:MAG: hypothetical protein KDA84_13670 [Planctomycetaceae bacterium]|nr:hypothetical protein [Planctomycetaceae bacterium]
MVSDSPVMSDNEPLDEDHPELPAPWGRTVVLLLASLLLSSGICWCLGRDKLPNETGQLSGYAVPLVSDWTGKIESFFVQPGDFVQEGDPIVVLVDERLPVQITRQQREVDDLEAALRRAEETVDAELTRQLRAIDAEIAVLKAETQSFLPPNGDAPEQTGGSQTERLNQLEMQRINLPHQLRKSAGVERIRGELVQSEAKLRHLQSLPVKLTLPSPVNGKVSRLLRAPGERVVQGTPLLELADQAQPYLIVEMPEPLAKRFALGDEIPLKFPGQKKGMGRVANMQRLENSDQESPSSEEESNSNNRIRVMIEPENDSWPQMPLESAVKVRTSDSNALSRRVH